MHYKKLDLAEIIKERNNQEDPNHKLFVESKKGLSILDFVNMTLWGIVEILKRMEPGDTLEIKEFNKFRCDITPGKIIRDPHLNIIFLSKRQDKMAGPTESKWSRQCVFDAYKFRNCNNNKNR